MLSAAFIGPARIGMMQKNTIGGGFIENIKPATSAYSAAYIGVYRAAGRSLLIRLPGDFVGVLVVGRLTGTWTACGHSGRDAQPPLISGPPSCIAHRSGGAFSSSAAAESELRDRERLSTFDDFVAVSVLLRDAALARVMVSASRTTSTSVPVGYVPGI
jgi:hypothetical protein